MLDKRYMVDERTGMAAIVDTFYPREGSCLDGPGVYTTVRLPTGDEFADERRTLLVNLEIGCNNLNFENTVCRKEADLVYDEYCKAKQAMNRIFGECGYNHF